MKSNIVLKLAILLVLTSCSSKFEEDVSIVESNTWVLLFTEHVQCDEAAWDEVISELSETECVELNVDCIYQENTYNDGIATSRTVSTMNSELSDFTRTATYTFDKSAGTYTLCLSTGECSESSYRIENDKLILTNIKRNVQGCRFSSTYKMK